MHQRKKNGKFSIAANDPKSSPCPVHVPGSLCRSSASMMTDFCPSSVVTNSCSSMMNSYDCSARIAFSLKNLDLASSSSDSSIGQGENRRLFQGLGKQIHVKGQMSLLPLPLPTQHHLSSPKSKSEKLFIEAWMKDLMVLTGCRIRNVCTADGGMKVGSRSLPGRCLHISLMNTKPSIYKHQGTHWTLVSSLSQQWV